MFLSCRQCAALSAALVVSMILVSAVRASHPLVATNVLVMVPVVDAALGRPDEGIVGALALPVCAGQHSRTPDSCGVLVDAEADVENRSHRRARLDRQNNGTAERILAYPAPLDVPFDPHPSRSNVRRREFVQEIRRTMRR